MHTTEVFEQSYFLQPKNLSELEQKEIWNFVFSFVWDPKV